MPFYALAHELYPGKFRPTISHSFIRLLSDKRLLLKLFTQNIDCLEREAGVPDYKIVEAHGSFAKQRCIECKTLYPDDLMKAAVERKDVPHCETPQCNGLVKPDIVFFGEQLPEEFHRNRTLPASADLCIVLGTSLTVQPFASLPAMCSEGVPRLLINKDRVGDLGSRADDVLLLGDCDAGVRELASALGWLEELESLWAETCPEEDLITSMPEKKSKDEHLEDEINKLTADVDKSLKLSSNHTAWLRDHLDKKHSTMISSNGSSKAEPRHENSKFENVETKSTVENPQLSASNGVSSHQGNSNNNGDDEWESNRCETEEREPNRPGSGLDHISRHTAKKPSL